MTARIPLTRGLVALVDAAHAYDNAARALHGDSAWLNFPEVTA